MVIYICYILILIKYNYNKEKLIIYIKKVTLFKILITKYSLNCQFKRTVDSTSYMLVYNVLITFLFGRMIWLFWWLKHCLMVCNNMYNVGLLGIKHISQGYFTWSLCSVATCPLNNSTVWHLMHQMSHTKTLTHILKLHVKLNLDENIFWHFWHWISPSQ